MTVAQKKPLTFAPLGNYHAPTLPAVDAMQALALRLRKLFKQPNDKPFISDDHLQRSTQKMLDDIVAPPACAPLLGELQATLQDWIATPAPTSWLKTVVLPPGDHNSLMEAWAHQQGHQLLAPPDRNALVAPASIELPDLAGHGVLVIPRLERWFLRHRNGLTLVRALLDRLDTLNRHCVIGCNSWAWEFLDKAVGAGMVLPAGVTFQAFDAMRLHDWLSELAHADHGGMRFRLSTTGGDVMEIDDEGKLGHDFFVRLAARSLGIPWVAWRLWRRSLRSGSQDDEEIDDIEKIKNEQADIIGNEQTLWVIALDEFSLPGSDNEVALLVLHALLLHGPLTLHELRLVLPLVGQSNVLSTLVSTGFVERMDDAYVCFPAAYPAIRSALATAGFSTDKL